MSQPKLCVKCRGKFWHWKKFHGFAQRLLWKNDCLDHCFYSREGPMDPPARSVCRGGQLNLAYWVLIAVLLVRLVLVAGEWSPRGWQFYGSHQGFGICESLWWVPLGPRCSVAVAVQLKLNTWLCVRPKLGRDEAVDRGSGRALLEFSAALSLLPVQWV